MTEPADEQFERKPKDDSILIRQSPPVPQEPIPSPFGDGVQEVDAVIFISEVRE